MNSMLKSKDYLAFDYESFCMSNEKVEKKIKQSVETIQAKLVKIDEKIFSWGELLWAQVLFL